METHWQSWHHAYDDPDSSLSRRLRVVKSQLAAALDEASSGPIRLLSLCAGDGRDVLGVLADHPRAPDVVATLVELDPVLAGRARRAAAGLGVGSVDVREADAGVPSNFARDDERYEVVACCGVFGNISIDEIRTTVQGLAGIVAPHGSVVWTRHRRAPDATGTVRRLFERAGFVEAAFVAVDGTLAAVGRARRLDTPAPRGSQRWFRFAGDGEEAHC